VGALIKQRASMLVDRLSSEAGKSREEARLARETERQRIAADFHDGPLQSFISFQIRLDVLRRILERDLAAGLEELGQLQRLSQAQVKELRSFVRSMRPVDSEASLVAAIRRLVDDFQKETGIAVTFVGGDKPVAVAPEISTDVLQMVREALHNVQKHAHASRVAVAVEQPGKALEISIDDNGAGFPFSGAYSLDELDLLRLGPVSLKRRARAVGADLSIESRPGRGAGLKLKIPL
jgi:two-component system NarL family sensor kinase